MRPFTRPSLTAALGPLLVSASLASCQVALPLVGPDGGDGAVLVLTPRLLDLAPDRRQLLATGYHEADIDHLVLDVYREDGPEVLVTSLDVAQADLAKTVTLANLRHDKTYRIQASAYLTSTTATLISTPTSSSVTVTLDAGFNQPTLASLPVQLVDTVFSGTLHAGLAITAGASTPESIATLQWTVDTFAGSLTNASGHVDDTGSAARFSSPWGVAVDASGNVYVADSSNNCIRMVTAAGVVSTLAGSATNASGHVDGTGSAARFFSPDGVAVDASGNVYVADTGNSCIRLVTAAGVVTTLAGPAAPGSTLGHTDATGSAARFSAPHGVAVDASGNVYVADTGNSCIRLVTVAGVVTTFAGSTTNASGHIDGTGSAARFFSPDGVAVDASGNVYVADTLNNCIRLVTAAGAVTTLAGPAAPGTTSGHTDATGSAARFSLPVGAAVDASGNVYVADYGNNALRLVTAAGVVTTLAGSATNTSGHVDGTGSNALFSSPIGVALDANGSVYVGDSGNSCIRQIK